MKYIIILFFYFFIIGCKQMDISSFKILYFKNGQEIELDNYQSEKIIQNISKLFLGADQIIQQIVSEDFIKQVKEENEVIEISFTNVIELKSEKLGSYKIKKLLIPLSGDYVGNEEFPSVIIFAANDKGYITGPLGCSFGLEYIENIKIELLSHIKKE